jgi:hypothetical protein
VLAREERGARRVGRRLAGRLGGALLRLPLLRFL